MTQQILEMLTELKGGQEASEARLIEQLKALEGRVTTRLEAIEGNIRQIHEQDHATLLEAIQGVAATTSANSARITRLAELIERLAIEGGSGPKAVTG